jgi:sulfonate transport system substrate-binding protein
MQARYELSEIWHTFCPVVCASHVALAKGWFDDEFEKDGIKISYIKQLPVEEWQLHFTHRRQSLIRDGGNIPPIWAKSEGVDTKVIGMSWLDGVRGILVKTDSPISSVKELKGRKVALMRRLPNLIDFPRASEKLSILTALKAHGLGENDIQFVDIPLPINSIATDINVASETGWPIAPRSGWKIPQEPAVQALQSNEVDAITARAAETIFLEKAGIARVIYDVNSHPDLKYRVNIDHPYVCTASGDLVRDYPELLVRWMKVVVRAGRWASNNYDEVVKTVAKVTTWNEEAIKKSHPSDFHKKLVPEISEEGIECLEAEKDFLKAHGFINNDFDVRSWIDGQFLSTAIKEVEAES